MLPSMLPVPTCILGFIANTKQIPCIETQLNSKRHVQLIGQSSKYMEQFKTLVDQRLHNKKQPEQHKDKLAETKAREKEVKEAFKQQREDKKHQKEEERLAAAEANRFERTLFHNSKRAAKEEREAHKKEAKEATGFMCEHGVWRCRICQPVTKHK